MKSILSLIKPYALAGTIANWLEYRSSIEYQRDRQKLRFYRRFVKKNSLCFDVGANIGNRTEIFLKLGARVVAFEPQDVCMRSLQDKFGSNRRVVLVQTAIGEKEGEQEMLISSAHQLSTLSKDWLESVQTSGRFSQHRWDKCKIVPVFPLDSLIEVYGKPDFCKIDVEGYELEVLRGLSQPIKAISFEFTPEYIESTIECIRYLSNLDTYLYNYSVGESMVLTLQQWIDSEAMIEILSNLRGKMIFGDVYAKLAK